MFFWANSGEFAYGGKHGVKLAIETPDSLAENES
jgi:hypothetical protein